MSPRHAKRSATQHDLRFYERNSKSFATACRAGVHATQIAAPPAFALRATGRAVVVRGKRFSRPARPTGIWRPMTDRTPQTPDAEAHLPEEAEAEAVLLRLSAACAPGKSMSPMDVAQALMPKDQWQRALPLVRRVAVRLALEGRLMIYRKGKVVDPAAFRGVYRLGPPRDE